jgi:hypothetical protein
MNSFQADLIYIAVKQRHNNSKYKHTVYHACTFGVMIIYELKFIILGWGCPSALCSETVTPFEVSKAMMPTCLLLLTFRPAQVGALATGHRALTVNMNNDTEHHLGDLEASH